MFTFIFIVVSLFTIIFINIYVRSIENKKPEYIGLNDLKKEELLSKKTQPIAVFGLVFILVGILFINNSSYFLSDDEKKELQEEKKLVDELYESELNEKRIKDSIDKIPVAVLVDSAYSYINNDLYFNPLPAICIKKLEELIPKVKGTKFENKINKSIDSLNLIISKNIALDEIDQRKEYQNILRNNFLDNGLDIKVNVSGKNYTQIKLTYPLFNDVWFRRFEKDGHFDKLYSKGYKKIILTDGYDYTKWIKYE